MDGLVALVLVSNLSLISLVFLFDLQNFLLISLHLALWFHLVWVLQASKLVRGAYDNQIYHFWLWDVTVKTHGMIERWLYYVANSSVYWMKPNWMRSCIRKLSFLGQGVSGSHRPSHLYRYHEFERYASRNGAWITSEAKFQDFFYVGTDLRLLHYENQQ